MIVTALLLMVQAVPEECSEPETQSEMNICAKREFDRADEELNRVWHKAADEMKRLDVETDYDDDRPGYFAQLLAGQRAWLTFRDAHCASEGYLTRGGSMEPLMISTCMTTLTEARIEQLKEFMDWPE